MVCMYAETRAAAALSKSLLLPPTSVCNREGIGLLWDTPRACLLPGLPLPGPTPLLPCQVQSCSRQPATLRWCRHKMQPQSRLHLLCHLPSAIVVSVCQPPRSQTLDTLPSRPSLNRYRQPAMSTWRRPRQRRSRRGWSFRSCAARWCTWCPRRS